MRRSFKSRLSEFDKKDIADRVDSGELRERIARAYGISLPYVCIIYKKERGVTPVKRSYEEVTKVWTPRPERCLSKTPSAIEGSTIRPPSLARLMAGR